MWTEVVACCSSSVVVSSIHRAFEGNQSPPGFVSYNVYFIVWWSRVLASVLLFSEYAPYPAISHFTSS